MCPGTNTKALTDFKSPLFPQDKAVLALETWALAGQVRHFVKHSTRWIATVAPGRRQRELVVQAAQNSIPGATCPESQDLSNIATNAGPLEDADDPIEAFL